MNNENMIPVGFFLSKPKHTEIAAWCKEHSVTMDALCRTALYHFFFQITQTNKNKDLDFYEKTRLIYPY